MVKISNRLQPDGRTEGEEGKQTAAHPSSQSLVAGLTIHSDYSLGFPDLFSTVAHGVRQHFFIFCLRNQLNRGGHYLSLVVKERRLCSVARSHIILSSSGNFDLNFFLRIANLQFIKSILPNLSAEAKDKEKFTEKVNSLNVRYLQSVLPGV